MNILKQAEAQHTQKGKEFTAKTYRSSGHYTKNCFRRDSRNDLCDYKGQIFIQENIEANTGM